MADARPFRGARYTDGKSLGRRLCPPYDVIPPELAAGLRKEPRNAVRLELPAGDGAAKYAGAKALWRRWHEDGTLTVDPRPAFYVVEERFKHAGRARTRRGFLAGLGASSAAARSIIPHERTLAKPKADRLRMLRSVGANISPIFGVFSDGGGKARKALAAATRGRPAATGRSHAGVEYKLWRVDEPGAVAALRSALRPADVLIADGHHRYEVSRVHARSKAPGSDAVLCYLVPETDSGLVVLPTHRVARRSLIERAMMLARLTKLPSLAALEKRLEASRNPYAFGLVEKGWWLGEPASPGGCRSGLCVEWLAEHLLKDVAPDEMSYTPDARLAASRAAQTKGSAVLVKGFAVAQVREAASRVGLLPQKSTYFFPKIATGLVFRPLRP